MQSHTTPSAHVCTTLPPGNLALRDRFPNSTDRERISLISDCGRVRRSYTRTFDEAYGVPVGTWRSFEERADDTGERWIKQTWGVHYVVDDFGFLVVASSTGGAA